MSAQKLDLNLADNFQTLKRYVAAKKTALEQLGQKEKNKYLLNVALAKLSVEFKYS